MEKSRVFQIDPALGPVTLRLQAERAHAMKGVLSCRDIGHPDPCETDDASVVEWDLPPAAALCVVYGIVLPQKKVWFSPSYTRTLIQGGKQLEPGENPRRFKTEQHAEGEWVGPPESFRLVLKGS